MTIVKTVAVCSAAHAKNLRNYLDDPRAIYREGINLSDVEGWERQMALTREAYGHDKISRKGAKNTILYHQILAFNADDCALNGRDKGIGSGAAVEYARQWCEREYPNQEVLMVLHKEHCEADGTDRWAVHLGINRTDMETGKRYDPGLPHKAKAHRAALARELDKEWNLKQVERGKANSKVHTRQPSKAVKEIDLRGGSEITSMTADVAIALNNALDNRESQNMIQDMARELREKGIRTTYDARQNDLKFTQENGYSVRGANIGFSLDYVRQRIGVIRQEIRVQVKEALQGVIDRVITSDYTRSFYGFARDLKQRDVVMSYRDKTVDVTYTYLGQTFKGSEVGASRDALSSVFREKDAKFGGCYATRDESEKRFMDSMKRYAPQRYERYYAEPNQPSTHEDRMSKAWAAHKDQRSGIGGLEQSVRDAEKDAKQRGFELRSRTDNRDKGISR